MHLYLPNADWNSAEFAVPVSAQTLYAVSATDTSFNPWANASLTLSAIGTAGDGGTTYVEVASPVPSFYVTDVDLRGSSVSTLRTVDVPPFTGELPRCTVLRRLC